VTVLDDYSSCSLSNEDPDLEVGFVQAVDADTDLFNKHTFSLQTTSDSPFRISPNTGRITTNRALDREERGVYSLTVVAMDTSEPTFPAQQRYPYT